MSRRGTLLVGGILLATSVGCTPGSPLDDRPNVVLVLVDALRRDHLGLYGYSRPTSPYLDQIAAESLVFDQAYAHGSQTLHSTASLFTSRFFPTFFYLEPPADIRDRLKIKPGRTLTVLAPSDRTFVHGLTAGGYRTLGLLTNPHHHMDSGFPEIFSERVLLTGGSAPSPEELPYASGAEVNKVLLQWLTELPDCSLPFFTYVHYMDVHNPYRPPPEFARLFVSSHGKDKYVNAVPEGSGIPTEDDLDFMIQNYDGEIRYVDSLTRDIHHAAIERCPDRRTILIVTSDHGDEFMDHGGLGHGRTLEKELIWIPLILHGAGAAGRYSHLVRQVDLGPTVLALAGEGIRRGLDGRDLLPELSGGGTPAAELEERASIANYGSLMSLTTARWHFILDRHEGSVKLYDNRADPEGRHDLASQRPDAVSELRERLQPFLQMRREAVKVGRELVKSYEAEDLLQAPRQEVIEQLRSLGYLQ